MTGALGIHLNNRIEEVILPLIGRDASHVCIIDPPGHPNVGDSAILLGELDFIAKNFPAARVSCYDVDSYSQGADRFIEEATILLIHGGGNFGDIWPHHHELRMRVLNRFSHKRIIQMPQSIHFDDVSVMQATAAAIKKQSSFTLLVRDLRSLEYARQHFECETLLSPDMAFSMQPVTRKPPTVDYFCLLRTDKEAVINREVVRDTLTATIRSVEVDDWLDERLTLTARLDYNYRRLTRKLPSIAAPLRSAAMRLRQQYAMQRLTYGIALLSKGATVVTDRLHAHILCCLLGIPHLTFDSYDGKISAFYNTWTKDQANAKLVTSVPDFLQKLRQPLI